MMRIGVPVLLVLCISVPVRAQSEYLELYALYARPQLYVESFVLPAQSGSIAYFSVRVPNSLLVFKREQEPAVDFPFAARVELTVQVHAGDRLVAERIWRTTHRARSYEESVSRDTDLEATIQLAIEPGSYVYRVWVRDLDVDTPLPAPPKRLVVPDFEGLAVGPPVITSAPPALPGELRPANLGGYIPLNAQSWLTLPVSLPPGTGESGVSLTYRYLQLPSHDVSRADVRRRRQAVMGPGTGDWWNLAEEAKEAVDQEKVVSTDTIRRDAWLGLAPISDPDSSTTSGILRLQQARDGRHFLVGVPVPTSVRGRLALELRVHGVVSEVDRTEILETHWRNMPLSLYSVQTAIRNLSFIETREKIREMLQGSDQDRREAFEVFWEERDPTPGTPENELMDEYYRRVDHAAHEFRTGKRPGPDGLATDQARIYVVHGPPLKIERAFPDSGGVEETWVYDQGRRFVFWAATSLDPLALQSRGNVTRTLSD